MRINFTLPLLGLALLMACQTENSYTQPQPIAEAFECDYQIDRYEPEIRTFEKDDLEKGIKTGEIVFYGSSSWRLWKDMKTDLAPLPVVNHGFGGSTIPELIHYLNRAVFPYQPKMLVIYGGENDLALGKYKSAEQMFDSYRELITLVKNRFPTTKICYVSMKLSPSRRKHWETFKKGNALIKMFTAGCTEKNLSYVDINPLLFNANGSVKGELYTQDSLHLNPQGYREYAKVLVPYLKRRFN